MCKKLILFLTFTTCLFAETINVQAAADASAITLLNYGAIGAICIFLLIGAGFVFWFLFKEVRETLKELKAFVTNVANALDKIKEQSDSSNNDTINHERIRSSECYEKIVKRMDEHAGTSKDNHYHTDKQLLEIQTDMEAGFKEVRDVLCRIEKIIEKK